MKTEKDKMLAGEIYNPADPELAAGRLRARRIIREFNAVEPEDEARRSAILKELFGSAGEGVLIEPPFYCDYGFNVHAEDNVFFNFDCVILDSARVEIGSWTKFAPGVHIYTATHPLSVAARRAGEEFALPVRIGRTVWVGGGAIICPGVTIGDGSVIGAGSVVTKDVPAGVLAVGNPCRVVRDLP